MSGETSALRVGLSPGCETAPWNLTDAKLTLNWCLQYSWRTSKDNLYLCDNETNLGKNSGQYAYNNLQAFGGGHWIGTTVLLRPEVRYERSYDNPAYQNGTKKSQLTAAGDVIFFF